MLLEQVLLQTRYKSSPNDPKFPYLFHCNIDIEQHNQNILSLLPSVPIVLNSIDNKIDELDIENHANKHMHMPSTIVLKQEMLIELIGGKFSIYDRLMDSANEIFKLHTTIEKDILWVEFTYPTIGLLQ